MHKLSAVYFREQMPLDPGTRVGALHSAGDPALDDMGWELALVDSMLVASKAGRVLVLAGYACTLEVENAAEEGFEQEDDRQEHRDGDQGR